MRAQNGQDGPGSRAAHLPAAGMWVATTERHGTTHRTARGVSAVAELILQHSARVLDEEGSAYLVRVWADRRRDGMWEGWLEFAPVDGLTCALRTSRETSQPNRGALEYWATGLEPVYLDGAFARARGRLL